MPGSVQHFDNLFKQQIINLNPVNVLDVGVGYGKWGRIVKELLPNCTIHGIEPETSYIKKYETEKIYNKIYNKSIQKFIQDDMNNGEKYDLVICGDVLEHLFLSEVHDVLDFFSYRCKWFIVQFPSNVPQYAVDGIKWEVHRSNLKLQDFSKYDTIYYASMRETSSDFSVYDINHHYLILSMMLDFDKISPMPQ